MPSSWSPSSSMVSVVPKGIETGTKSAKYLDMQRHGFRMQFNPEGQKVKIV